MIKNLLGDREVVEAIYSDNRDELNRSFRLMYKNYFPMIRRLVVSKGGSTADAADVFQESLAIFFNQIKEGKFRGESSTNTYLFGIARNIWYKSLMLRTRENVDRGYSDSSDYPQIGLDPPTKRCLKKLIQELLGDCGEVLLDFYFRGLSMDEIRDKHGLGSTQAAKNKKLRCMKRLINRMAQKGITVEAFHN